MSFNTFMYMDSTEDVDDHPSMQYESGREPVVRTDDGLVDAWVQRKVKAASRSE